MNKNLFTSLLILTLELFLCLELFEFLLHIMHVRYHYQGFIPIAVCSFLGVLIIISDQVLKHRATRL